MSSLISPRRRIVCRTEKNPLGVLELLPREVGFSEEKSPPPLLTFRDECVQQAHDTGVETVLLVCEDTASRGRGCFMPVTFILPSRPRL